MGFKERPGALHDVPVHHGIDHGAGESKSVTVQLGADGKPTVIDQADDIPVLREDDAPELPSGATLNEDASITLPLLVPVVLKFKKPGGTPQEEPYDHLSLRRLTGTDMRKVIAASGARSTALVLSAATGLSQAKVALLQDRMDAADVRAAQAVIVALLGMGDGLPKRAEHGDDGSITLPLLTPTEDGDGVLHEALAFRRLTGADLTAIAAAKDDTLPVAIHRATGLTLREKPRRAG